MALQWDWKEKIGEATLVQMHPDEPDREFTLDLYQGNAYLIMIHEFKDDKGEDVYSLTGFFMDYAHMKACLGLSEKTKGNNIYNTPSQRITKIRINKDKCRHAAIIVRSLVEAFDNIRIEIYSEEETG